MTPTAWRSWTTGSLGAPPAWPPGPPAGWSPPAAPRGSREKLPPQVLLASCQQLGLSLSASAWGELDELQRFALVKLSHPGHEHRNLPRAFAEFGLVA